MNLYDMVTLKRAFPEKGVAAGAVGTIVMVYDDPGVGYEVEVPDGEGGTLAVLTVEPEDIEPLQS